MFAVLASSGLALAQGFGRAPMSAAAATGKTVFESNCSFCHGSDAEGRSGPDLTSSALVASDANGNLIGTVVLNGRSGTAMPAFKLTRTQIEDIAAFLHYQTSAVRAQKGGRKGVSPDDLQTGDAAAGKAYFNGAGGCSTCHSPSGDLAGVANRLQGLQLEESFLTVPADTVRPKGEAPPRFAALLGGVGQPKGAIATVSVTLPTGQTIKGELAYQDDFDIALIDAAGYYHSWPTSQVKFTVDDPAAAHGRMLSKYTDADIHNLMAYLQTLTGPSAPAAAPPAPPAPSAAVLALNPGATKALLLHPPASSWPTYNGSYTSQHHTPLTQINPSNVNQLGTAWQYSTGDRAEIKSSPLVVDGILYFTAPDNVWAVDARTGHLVWHYTAPDKGNSIGNRGVGMYGNWLYFELPDDRLVSLNAKDGSVRWIKEIANQNLGYWTTEAPLVAGDHVLIGESGDLDNVRSFLRSVDPVTGDTQWTWYSTPEGLTGGNTWITGSYDPSLNLIYWGTGNPTPVIDGDSRPGPDLYTDCIVALNADTGELVWDYQVSPHDTHDWDAVETPELVDGTFNGKPRKMLMQASRNGLYVLLDRTNGKDLLTTPFGPVNWMLGLDKNGTPIPNPEKDPARDGRLVAPAEAGLTNFRASSFDPQTGLYVINSSPSYGIYFYKKADGNFGWAGADYGVFNSGVLEAIDYQTGKARWKHQWATASGAGVLTTGAGLTFTGDGQGNIVALATSNGQILWHAATGARSGASPISYELDGRQYVVSSFGSTIFAWALTK